ncbi:MAG: metallophosphoesterase [Phycisphaerales bacterium]|nr:metallophosphoesterase [Phycisphaerales bacterium]
MTDARPPHPRSSREERQARNKLRRARVRRFIFSVGPSRLSGGRLLDRHLARDVETREMTVRSPHWPASLSGLRIGHVSDFHLGDLLPIDRALVVIEQLAALEPDLIAITGDAIDLEHAGAEALFSAAASIGAPLGAAFVLGNHDELVCGETLARIAADAGCLVLRNEVAELVWNGRRLRVGGVDWSKSAMRCARQVDQVCGDEPVDLLLSHNPRSFDQAAGLGVPLTLAGHTHGGQVALRRGSDANLAMAHRRSVGLYERDGCFLYVTTGVGAWFPLRINCPPEIALIRVESDPPDPPTDQ